MIPFDRLKDITIILLRTTDEEQCSTIHTKHIVFGYIATFFGKCFIAFQENAMCMMHFTDTPCNSLEELKNKWKNAHFIENNSLIEEKMKMIFSSNSRTSLTIYLQGSDFRFKIWEALLALPFGATLSYEALAQQAQMPKAVRAAASAVANNPVALLIPCHRIIRKNGDIGNYRWGSKLKQEIINWEKTFIK